MTWDDYIRGGTNPQAQQGGGDAWDNYIRGNYRPDGGGGDAPRIDVPTPDVSAPASNQPVFGHYTTEAERADMNARAPMVQTGPTPQVATQDRARPSETPMTPLSDAAQQTGGATLPTIISAILGEAGRGLNSAWGQTQGGEVGSVNVGSVIGSMPGIGIPSLIASAYVPGVADALKTPIRDVPVLGTGVRALEAVGGAANADWNVIGEPAISALALLRETIPPEIRKAGRANEAAMTGGRGLISFIMGDDNPQLFTSAGVTPDEGKALMNGFLYGTNNAEQSRKFEEMLHKMAPREQEVNPFSSAVIGQVFSPSTYLDIGGVIPKLSAIQEMRRVYGAAGDVTNAGKVLREGGNPLENLLYRAFQPGNIKEGEVLSEKAAQIVRPPDTTAMARAFRAFKKTPIAQTTDNVARAIGNIGPYLTDAGRTLDDKLKWLNAMSDVARTKVKTPELLQWEKSFGVKNAPDYHTLLHAIGKFDSKPVVDGYRRANEILDSLGQTIGTRRGPVFNADLATYAVEQAKGSPYAPVFDQVVEAWKRGDLDVTQAKMALERVAGVQLTADLTDHLAANLAQMAGIQKPNFVTNFVNRMKNLEGALYVGGNPGSIVQNVMNDMFTQLRHGAAPQTEKQLDEFFARLGAPYVDNLGQKVRGSVDATRDVTDNLEGARSAYGTTLPNWLTNVPGVKQMNEAFQRNQAWGRKVANATGIQRAIAQNMPKPNLPAPLKTFYGAEAGRIENQLRHVLNIEEGIAILKDGKMNWARFVDEFADEINQLLRPIAAREMGITPDMMHDALSPMFTENLNRALNDALEASARGEDVVAAFRKARGKYWGGDDLFGAAPTTVSPPPSSPPGGGGAATSVDSFWNKVPANKLNYMQEQQRVFLENNKRAPSVAELEAMLAGKNPAPEVPLTQPKQAQAPTPKPVTPTTLPPMADNYLKPLTEYTDTLYRETGAQEAVAHLTGSNLMDNEDIFFANKPDMALGQGGKGFRLEFDANGIQGQVNRNKPAWELAYQNGDVELIAKKNSARTLQQNVKSVTVMPDAYLSKVERSKFNQAVAGWEQTKNADGSITYRKPVEATNAGNVTGGTVTVDVPDSPAVGVQPDSAGAGVVAGTQAQPNLIEQVKQRAAALTQPTIKRDLIREWAALFHEGAPENEMRAISRSIEKWGDDVLLEKAKSYIDRARASGQTWPTMWADMAEERAHYLLAQIEAGNPKYADTAYWMERVANGDALTRLLRGGENGFDWTKLERPYEYRPYESFAQYRKRVTDANIERDFIRSEPQLQPTGDTSPVTASAGVAPEPVAPTSGAVGGVVGGNDVAQGGINVGTSKTNVLPQSPVNPSGTPVAVPDKSRISQRATDPVRGTLAANWESLEKMTASGNLDGILVMSRNDERVYWSPTRWKSPADALEANPNQFVLVNRMVPDAKDVATRDALRKLAGDAYPQYNGEWADLAEVKRGNIPTPPAPAVEQGAGKAVADEINGRIKALERKIAKYEKQIKTPAEKTAMRPPAITSEMNQGAAREITKAEKEIEQLKQELAALQPTGTATTFQVGEQVKIGNDVFTVEKVNPDETLKLSNGRVVYPEDVKRVRNASDANLRGIDPNEMHTGGDFRQRFNDAAEEMKQAGPTAATDPALNRKTMHALEQALLDRVEEELGKGVNTAGKLPPQVEAEMMRYLKDEFMPNLNGVKAGANAAGRFFQDATVLNYDGAWNIESALLLERPFVHWWLHSALNYGRDFLDHPAMLAFMLRLANNLHAESNRLVDEGKMPKRFRNTFKVSMPFEIPGMGDTLWINPLRTVFPFEDVLMLNAQERAGYQTVKEDGTVDPSSIINDTFGIHTPYKLAYNALTQDSEEFWHSVASIPALKLLRAGTGIGIPSKFDASYYERAIKELVADGTLTQEQANVALLQQSGKDWDTVKQRANLENYTMREGSALFGMRGQVFTPGEQKYYDSKRAKEQAYQDAVRKLGGNPNMDPDQRNKFLKDRGYYSTPEYQQLKAQYPETDTLANIAYDEQGNHMPLDQAQEARAREYYLDKIGEAYWNAPELKQKLIAEDLGDEFKTLFRNKDTRNLDAVPMSTVLGWANALDQLLQEPVAGANLPNPDPYKLTFTTDAQNKAYQTMYDEVQNSYGWQEYNAAWDKYYALKEQNKDAAKAFLNSPEGKKLGAVRDYIAKFYDDNQDVRAILEKAGLKKTATTTTPSDPRGAALNQAVQAAGLNWDTIEAHNAVYDKLPKGTGARSQYLAEHPDYARYKNIARAIYGDDSEQSQYSGGSSRTYSRNIPNIERYVQPRGYPQPAQRVTVRYGELFARVRARGAQRQQQDPRVLYRPPGAQ